MQELHYASYSILEASSITLGLALLSALKGSTLWAPFILVSVLTIPIGKALAWSCLANWFARFPLMVVIGQGCLICVICFTHPTKLQHLPSLHISILS